MSANDIDQLQQMLDSVTRTMAAMEPDIDIAAQEIDAAQRRHPHAADLICHSFALLRRTFSVPTELVYRSHCRELLDRVADGQDTRPGTAAECCVALCETSLRVPLNTSGAGLYARMWRLAGLPPLELSDASAHYEALAGSQIDDDEAWLRDKLRQRWRVLLLASPDGA